MTNRGSNEQTAVILLREEVGTTGKIIVGAVNGLGYDLCITIGLYM